MSDFDSERFQLGFVAGKYLSGVRGKTDDLLAGLPGVGVAAQSLARGLCHESRPIRAQVLAPVSARLMQGLNQRRLR